MNSEVLMVDLKGQYKRLKTELDQAALEVIAGGWYIGGTPVKEFSEALANYHGIDHVTTCGNGTDALQIALMALGIKPGDEVIVPSFTYIASAEVIALLGATPVFVDVDASNFNIDAEKIKEAISSKTKAVIVVHLYGQCADMEEILKLTDEHGIPVIEDGAQSIGADYLFSDQRIMKSGAIGTIGCTSFFPTKNLGAYGDGGAIMTKNSDLAEKIKMISNHGQRKKYYHEVLGVNSRLDTLQAAILNVKIKYLNDFIDRRRVAAGHYDHLLTEASGVSIPQRMEYSTHAFHQYTLILDPNFDRDTIKEKLASKGVPSMVYYPCPQHLQKGFVDNGINVGDLSNSVKLSNSVLSLPMHTELTEAQIQYICHTLLEVLNNEG